MAPTESRDGVVELDKAGLHEHFLTLTECQRPFVRLVVDWIRRPRKTLIVVSGGPGTGKSYVVKNTLDHVKCSQLRMSFTARSAQAIGGQTIHSSVNLNWKPGSACAELERELEDETDLAASIEKSREIVDEFRCKGYPDVVVVDEVAMINGWLMYWLIRYFMDRTVLPLLFVCLGDPHQLNPVRSIHNLFSITFTEKMYYVRRIHLTESKRFAPEYERLIDGLRDFVDKGDETGAFAFVTEHFPVVESVDAPLLARANRAMAFRNDRVRKFNKFYIENMAPGPKVDLGNGLIVKKGCMVFVTKNGCSPKAKNGTQLVFQRVVDENRVLCSDPKTGSDAIVWKDEHDRYNLDLGFAGTVHKFQGDTIDDAKIVISFNGNRNLNLVYTALSRVKNIDQILAIEL